MYSFAVILDIDAEYQLSSTYRISSCVKKIQLIIVDSIDKHWRPNMKIIYPAHIAKARAIEASSPSSHHLARQTTTPCRSIAREAANWLLNSKK